MESIITSEIIVAYTQCRRKAYLLLFSPNMGEPHEYVRILEEQRRANQERSLDLLKQEHAGVQPYTMENLRNGSEVLINACLKTDGVEATCGVLTKVEGHSTFGQYNYEPTTFVGTHSISKEQKLELFFVGHVLERLQHEPPVTGRIVGMDGKSQTFKLKNIAKVIRPLLESLQEWIAAPLPEPPPVILNKNCPTCPFQRLCQTQAKQEDNLSLLDAVTTRTMRQYERKGIFTVKQLSFLFKPRKRKKQIRKSPSVTHKVELQA
jgi:predicted RecB family nuclease